MESSSFIERPLIEINKILETIQASEWSNYHQIIQNKFKQEVYESNLKDKLFSLTASNHKQAIEYHNKLVRFRGMMQDNSYGQEMFIPRYEESDKNYFNAYRDHGFEEQAIEQEIDVSKLALEDRNLVKCISIPNLFNSAGKNEFPIEVVLKFYNDQEMISVAELIDVIGVCSVIENQIFIHVILIENINSDQLYNNLNNNSELEDKCIKKELIENIKLFFNMDETVSQILCLFLLNIQYKMDELLSLNIIVEQSFKVKQFIAFLQSILPIVNVIDLTIQQLNETQFVPNNLDDDGLKWEKLQLPKASLLIINETVLQEGKLNENGIHNLNYLKSLSLQNQLVYKHSHFNQIMSADYSILILSNQTSLIESKFKVKVKKHSEPLPLNTSTENNVYPLFQYYLSKLIDVTKYDIKEEIRTYIQEDYVDMRKQNKLSYQNSFIKKKDPILFNESDLNILLCLLKLDCFSNITTNVENKLDWDHVKNVYNEAILSFLNKDTVGR